MAQNEARFPIILLSLAEAEKACNRELMVNPTNGHLCVKVNDEVRDINTEIMTTIETKGGLCVTDLSVVCNNDSEVVLLKDERKYSYFHNLIPQSSSALEHTIPIKQ